MPSTASRAHLRREEHVLLLYSAQRRLRSPCTEVDTAAGFGL